MRSECACSSIGREWFGVGVAPRALVPVLARVYLVDLLLAPIGFLAALAAVDEPFGFVAVLPLAVLFALLAADRRERIGETIDLTDAFETASTVARETQQRTVVRQQMRIQRLVRRADAP